MKTIKLTQGEINHLIGLLYDEKERGEYYGNREQHGKRQERLIKKLEVL